MNSEPMLEIHKISKKYLLAKNRQKAVDKPYKLALDEVSFTLTPGIYGLLGPNGAGKSTLMNIITGILTQSNDKVLWRGKNILNLRRKFRRELGYMPQQQGLYDNFTGRQFLYYMAALKNIASKKATEEILSVAKTVNLLDELDKKLAAYSGGMKQRLLLGCALLASPSLLILDEPTAGLDPKERVRLRDFLKGLSENRIILVATHVVSDIESIADEILLLKEGKLVDKGTPIELIDRYCKGESLEQVYMSVFGDD